MNLTRRILERIHEVELEITPEFQKEPEGIDAEVLNKAFEANGWKLVSAHSKTHEGIVTNSYEHPLLAGATIRFSYNTEDNYVWGQMLVDAGPGSEPDWWPATPKEVEGLTKSWLEVGEEYPSIEGAIHALKSVGWVVVATSSESPTEKNVVFQHEGVGEAIIVRADKRGAVTDVRVLMPDGSSMVFTPTVEEILKKAKTLMNKGEENAPADAPKVIRRAIEAVDGWEMKGSSTEGGEKYHVQMKFAYPTADDVIVVRVGVDGKIMSAFVERLSGMTDILTPELDNIVQRAKAIKSWVD